MINKKQNKGLLQAFKKYKKHYPRNGKSINIFKLLPEIIYRTMRLEGENITRKQTKSLFR